jgi:5'-deoxynucleotidase YfbR-like HD superfamily hydrolase
VIDFLRNAGETRRYHTWPVLRQQNVAEHSFHVAMLCSWLSKGDPSQALLMAALTHDLAEHKMGDLPSPVKRKLPDYPQGSFRSVWDQLEEEVLAPHGLAWAGRLNPSEAQILRIADAADGCLYCTRERAMGNRLIDEVYHNFRMYLGHEMLHYPSIELIEIIDNEWSKACGR